MKRSVSHPCRGAATVLSVWLAALCAAAGAAIPANAAEDVDTALIVAIDVSRSVDEERYDLQMDGVAQALEDDGVLHAILSGPNHAIVFSLVVWADHPRIAVPWQRIASKEDAAEVAALVRGLENTGGEFTCLTRMLRYLNDSVVPEIPAKVGRIVVDVSGDGIDNCSETDAGEAERNELLATGATINGLPIIVEGENTVVGSGTYRAPGYGLRELPPGADRETTTLDEWYRANVIGGPGAFVLAAQGYADFGRAFRQKFVTEISAVTKRFSPVPPGAASGFDFSRTP